jgi:hypothetical protein
MAQDERMIYEYRVAGAMTIGKETRVLRKILPSHDLT